MFSALNRPVMTFARLVLWIKVCRANTTHLMPRSRQSLTTRGASIPLTPERTFVFPCLAARVACLARVILMRPGIERK